MALDVSLFLCCLFVFKKMFIARINKFISFLFSSSFNPAGQKIIVRTEEVCIVGFVLILWIGAIALFFNRWGKIRMLEPYQPKFQQQHRSSCPLVDLDSLNSHPVTTIWQTPFHSTLFYFIHHFYCCLAARFYVKDVDGDGSTDTNATMSFFSI